ncbi:hypothetical protein [Paenibacillus amylolyticus]|uniref:hypothetical protein n=1 Tax=Paenibacillus amylolyticus TaxID=1451 RepID=UPI003EBD19B2
MSSLFLNKLSKETTNYSVSRKEINGCASEGYIFTSNEIEVASLEILSIAMQLIQQPIVQTVEVHTPDQTVSFALIKTINEPNNFEIVNEEQAYFFRNHDSTQGKQINEAIIKLTTFDIPSKHLRKMSGHLNSFKDVTDYFCSNYILPLTQTYPEYTPNPATITDFQQQLINCDQVEYRVKQLIVHDMESKYFNLDMMLGEKGIADLVHKVNESQAGKVVGIYYIDAQLNETVCTVQKDSHEHLAIDFWAEQDVHARDIESIFDINCDYVSLLVELNRTDLESLATIKSGQEALQYICK